MANVVEYEEDRLRELVPWPTADANKYTRGKLVLVAGSARYPGAACLAARAAQRAGAGYVEVVCAPESVSVVRAYAPSLVVRAWDAWGASEVPALRAGRPCACVVGPGFDARDEWACELALDVIARAEAPVLVDGGALSALASEAGLRAACERAQRGDALVVTPHGGEAARMARAAGMGCLGEDSGNTASDFANALARAYCCTVVLKGPDTYVADGTSPDDAPIVAMREGTSALAKAGTGDVLAGIVGALLAQGLDRLDAGVLGATLHARAGAAVACELTSVCVTPEDVIDALPQVLVRMRQGGGD